MINQADTAWLRNVSLTLPHWDPVTGSSYAATILHQVFMVFQMMFAVNDAFVKPAMEAIVQGARTGQVGDGKIFILDLAECIRIRTGETDGVAIG